MLQHSKFFVQSQTEAPGVQLWPMDGTLITSLPVIFLMGGEVAGKVISEMETTFLTTKAQNDEKV